MPRGMRHIETGTLRTGCWGYSLHVDGGGIWELDVRRSPRKLLGTRVIVEGTRAGFNLLDVSRIVPAGEGPQEVPLWRPWPVSIGRSIFAIIEQWRDSQNG